MDSDLIPRSSLKLIRYYLCQKLENSLTMIYPEGSLIQDLIQGSTDRKDGPRGPSDPVRSADQGIFLIGGPWIPDLILIISRLHLCW